MSSHRLNSLSPFGDGRNPDFLVSLQTNDLKSQRTLILSSGSFTRGGIHFLFRGQFVSGTSPIGPLFIGRERGSTRIRRVTTLTFGHPFPPSTSYDGYF